MCSSRRSSRRSNENRGSGFLGIEINEARNAETAAVICTDGSRVTAHVIRTDEDLMIARSVCRVLGLGRKIEITFPDRVASVRRNFRKLVSVAVVVCSGWLLAGCATRPVVNGIPNFAEVAPGLYRGGQPNDQGWQFLRSLGVTNVVKLNREVADPSADDMNVYFIPLPPATIWEVFQQPSSNDVWRAVHAMTLGGTYVHCEHGRDRAGLVVGCYRMWIDGWNEAAAAREMSAMGYRWSIPGLTAFWRSASLAPRWGYTP